MEVTVMEIVNAISLIESADMSTVNKTLTTISNFQKVVQATLKDGFDFGVIPGTPKPTLYKPGAEKICQLMKVNPEYEFLDRVTDFDKGFFNYELRCTLFHNLINEKGELIRKIKQEHVADELKEEIQKFLAEKK